MGIRDDEPNWLVVEPTHLKNMLVKLDHFPNFRDENKNIWNHQPAKIGQERVVDFGSTPPGKQLKKPSFEPRDWKTRGVPYFPLNPWLFNRDPYFMVY